MTLNNSFRRFASYLNDQPIWSWALIVPVILLSWIKFPALAGRGATIFSSSRCLAGSDSILRIASYNIHRAKGTDHIRDLSRVADNLVGLDLLALQEVAGPMVWGGENQASRLAGRLGLGWLYAPTRYRAFKPDVGNALLSKRWITDWQYQPLPTTQGSARNILSATMSYENTPVTILATHIDRGPDRDRQLAFVLEEFTRHRYVILFGDLNTHCRQSPLQEFLLKNPGCDAIAEGGGPNPDDRIDWILTRGVVIGRSDDRPVGASDHSLYWLEITGLCDTV